jgi:hypothetical protein
VNTDVAKCWSAAIFLQQNPLARAAFEVVTHNLGISGYGIARQLDKDPPSVQKALILLLHRELISGSSELRDNFAPTKTGFGVKEVLATHPEILNRTVDE